MNTDQRKYPIGRYAKPDVITPAQRVDMIREMETLPGRLRALVSEMKEDLLDLSYREGGWTARQIIHHLADSHINMYVRLKLGLTEDHPTIKPYDENAWARITEANEGDVSVSIELLEALHKRIVLTLRGMKDEDFQKTYFHPESKKDVPLIELPALYSWHGNHHLGQIRVIAEGFGVKP